MLLCSVETGEIWLRIMPLKGGFTMVEQSSQSSLKYGADGRDCRQHERLNPKSGREREGEKRRCRLVIKLGTGVLGLLSLTFVAEGKRLVRQGPTWHLLFDLLLILQII